MLSGWLVGCMAQHVVDAVLAIRRPKESIDLHMVEIMEMQHKTDMDTSWVEICGSVLLPARRYASAGYRDRNVSVCLSVCHAPVLCQNEDS